jgi:membrane-associated phospholipid phosphatase
VLLGSLLATLLSSGGPVYFGRLTGLPDPYVPLMDYLQAAGEVSVVWALKVHDALWQSHMTGAYDFGSGISAMPSIHVATAVLFALLGWRVDRRLGIAFTVFAAVIMIGSVHLAWHYAVDGYLSAVLTVLIWRFCGWWVGREESPSTG